MQSSEVGSGELERITNSLLLLKFLKIQSSNLTYIFIHFHSEFESRCVDFIHNFQLTYTKVRGSFWRIVKTEGIKKNQGKSGVSHGP